eukprot:COSAG03_NODE_7527_length_905_cov_0.797767_1_plen_84_part_10
MVGSCAAGAAVIQVVGCVGVNSTGRDSELINLVFQARGSETSDTNVDGELGDGNDGGGGGGGRSLRSFSIRIKRKGIVRCLWDT